MVSDSEFGESTSYLNHRTRKECENEREFSMFEDLEGQMPISSSLNWLEFLVRGSKYVTWRQQAPSLFWLSA